MGWYENRTEMARYIAELKQLLAGTALSPDARARALAALLEADAMTQAADQMHTGVLPRRFTGGDIVLIHSRAADPRTSAWRRSRPRLCRSGNRAHEVHAGRSRSGRNRR
jgi:hypothetical protein